MAPRKIIIDTDPGIDDILAMLLAFSARPEELEVLLISVTYGNIDVQNCLRNVVTMFYHIEKELAWRKENGLKLGFDTLRHHKPLVAVGPEHPLADQILMADYFHGNDGLGGIHESHPHLTPADTWKHLFDSSVASKDPEEANVAQELQNPDALFKASKLPASEEILRLLRENEPDTITIVAVGPLTNLAHAAALDPETFLRAKEIVVMGGALEEQGNITPVAEFNTFADAVAAARVYALSSPNPSSTMPLPPPGPHTGSGPDALLVPYPSKLSRQLTVTLFTLDITNHHGLARGTYRRATADLMARNSPLAQWASLFVSSTLAKIESLQDDFEGDAVSVQLHDPLTIWYVMTTESVETAVTAAVGNDQGWVISPISDIRVETAGQWTRGQTIIDRRPRRRRAEGDDGEKPGDTGNWLSLSSGNRMRYAIASPAKTKFGGLLVERVFGLEEGSVMKDL